MLEFIVVVSNCNPRRAYNSGIVDVLENINPDYFGCFNLEGVIRTLKWGKGLNYITGF